jgi:hypothetical protein
LLWVYPCEWDRKNRIKFLKWPTNTPEKQTHLAIFIYCM